MKCGKCGVDIPVGRGFCSNCGSMVSMKEVNTSAHIQAASTGRKEFQQPLKSGDNGLLKVLVILVALLFVVLAVLGVKKYMDKKEEAAAETEVLEEISNEEAILGYWESTSKIEVGSIIESILEENDISEEVSDVLLKVLNISDTKVSLELYFKEDNTIRIGINGNFIGEQTAFSYEIMNDSSMIVSYSGTLKLPSVMAYGVVADLPDTDVNIAHTLKYAIEDGKLQLELFDEKVRLEKEE